jgi:hypothetical protein
MLRNPIRSETDAFRAAMVVVVLAVIAGGIGALTEPLIGWIALAALIAIALTVLVLIPERRRRKPLREAAQEPHPHGAPPGRRHVLVVANEPLRGERLQRRIGGSNGAEVELDVLAPLHSSRLHLAYTDIDEERRQARERLALSLQWASEKGFIARGNVGDPSSTTALEDEIRDFGPDEIIVVTASPEDRSGPERDALERLRSELDIPVTELPAA